MPKRGKLISLAVAVTTHCDGCIVVHTDAALKAGATREEISEALGVAVAMNAGAALIHSARVLDEVAAKTSQGQTTSGRQRATEQDRLHPFYFLDHRRCQIGS